MAPENHLDVVVVGGGAAGLYSALTAADAGSTVAVVSRKPLSESSSFWAQGGLAAAIGDGDSTGLHVQETLAAGRYSCRRNAAELLARNAPGVVWELERRGVEFDREPDGSFSLALEGGHTRRRVVHAGGARDGRRRNRPRRPVLPAGPVRGGRVRLHRPPRREPARLQRADRVLRARGASGLGRGGFGGDYSAAKFVAAGCAGR